MKAPRRSPRTNLAQAFLVPTLLLCLLLTGCAAAAGPVTGTPIPPTTESGEPLVPPTGTPPAPTAVSQGSIGTLTTVPTPALPKAARVATQIAEDRAALDARATDIALGTPVVYTPIPIPTDAPVPTPVSGITGCGAAYKGFYPGGCWAGQGNGEYVFVSAGAFTNAMEQGVIQVMTSTLDQRHFGREQTYQTPNQVGMVYPASVVWPRMTLIALPDTGPTRTFVFNMITRSWEPPGRCRLYPLALHKDTIQGLRPHYDARPVRQGTMQGAFGWLSWHGDENDGGLANSLTVPGDSETYANPDNPSDHVLTAGKWVRGRPAVATPSNVITALTRIQTDHFFVTVPVWDQTTGTGNTLRYHITSFARVSLDDVDAANPNQLTIRYWGQATCPPSP